MALADWTETPVILEECHAEAIQVVKAGPFRAARVWWNRKDVARSTQAQWLAATTPTLVIADGSAMHILDIQGRKECIRAHFSQWYWPWWVPDTHYADFPLDQVNKLDMWNFAQHHPIAKNINRDVPLKGGEIENDRVVEFTEKVRKHETWINGGFFVFEPGVLDYLPGDDEPLEQSPLANLARDGQLFAYKHPGFWHPMDTVRDREQLERLCAEGTPPWLQFEHRSDPSARPMIYA